MLIRKAYKFRLKTTPEIEGKLLQFSGNSRFVWNKALNMCLERLHAGVHIPRYYKLDFWSKLWKKSQEYGFLGQCHSQILQQKLKDLDRAFRYCFDKKQPNKRLPQFKKKGQHDSFRYVQGFKIDDKRLYLPKIGWAVFF